MDFETRFLLEDLSSLDLGGIRDCEEKLLAFNAAWARLQSEEPGWPTEEDDRRFHSALLEWLRFSKAMLVGELVPETLTFLRSNPESPARSSFRHVLVDEYQDLNRAEQELLEIVAAGGMLTIVGDEDQSIYSFKHAHPEGIRRFQDTHPTTLDETLDECRRCPTIVIGMANNLIQNNVERDPRVLTPTAGAREGDAHIVQWNSLSAEVSGLARFIHQRIQDGQVAIGKVLVLTPRRQIAYRLRDALTALGTPAISFFNEEALDGNPKMLDRSQAQQAFCLLTLLANPNDVVALRSWCGFGSGTLRAGAWRRIRACCEDARLSPREILEQLAAGSRRLSHTSELVDRFQFGQERLALMRPLLGGDLLDSLFPPEETWAAPFRAIASAIAPDNYDANNLLNEIRTVITQPELPTDVNFVRLMSLHKSKGLTADLVVIAGCIEGLIPFLDYRLLSLPRFAGHPR